MRSCRGINLVDAARPFAALAEGLIRGCIEHYKENIEIVTEDMSGGKGTAARFLLTRKDNSP